MGDSEFNVETVDEYIEKRIEMKLNDLLQTLPDKPVPPEAQRAQRINDMTISEIYKNTLQTSIDILNDISDMYMNNNYVDSSNYMTIMMHIFLKENRIIYVGIMLCIISFILYFIDGASV
jgi:hypothetical protein